MSRKRHAIFDLDGTLIDSLPGIAWSIDEALAACGLPQVSVDLRPLIGPPIRSILAAVSGLAPGDSLARLEQAFRASYDAEGWQRTLRYPGVEGLLLGLLDNHISLWVVTNKLSLATRKILDRLELDRFFIEVVCRDSVAPPYASKGEALLDLLERRRLPRVQCVLIGDTLEDHKAAQAAGIESVIVAHGYGKSQTAGRPEWEPVRAKFEEDRRKRRTRDLALSKELAGVGSYDRP